MKRSATLALGALAVGMFQVPAGAGEPDSAQTAATQSCSSTEFRPMSSGSSVLAVRQCSGSYVYGIGVSPDEAVQNLNGFMAVKEAGISCSANVNSVYPGSYDIGVHAQFSCKGYPITAIGSTPTIAANNALEIATEMAASGSHCSAMRQGSFYPDPHGYRFLYNCRNARGIAWSIKGLGSTIDHSNAAAMKLMHYTATNPDGCTFSQAELNGVIFNATLGCYRKSFRGYGSSVTSAATDALTQAGAN